LGSPNSYPNLAPFFLYITAAGKLIGVVASLRCFVLGCALAAAFGALFAARKMFDTSFLAAAFCAALYVGSLGFSNQLIAGHFGDLIAYAAFPWLVGALCAHYRAPDSRWVVLCCLSATACTVEIQFLFLDAVILAVFALAAWRKTMVWAALCTLGFVLLANCVTVVQSMVFGTNFGIFLRERAVLSWIDSQSSPLREAFYAAGYAPGYDRAMLTGFLVRANSISEHVALLLLLLGLLLYRRNRMYLAAAALYGIGVLLLSGDRGPAGAAIVWLFTHVRPASLLRELYHASQLVTLPLGLAVAGAVTALLTIRPIAARAVLLASVSLIAFACIAGPALGTAEKFLTPYVFTVAEQNAIGDAVARTDRQRIVIWPGQQPARSGQGAVGVDPLAYYPLADHWTIFSYNAGGVTGLAADLLYRGRFDDALRLYRRMSVGTLLLRDRMSFGLPDITLPRDRIELRGAARYVPTATQLRTIDALPQVRGGGAPLVVDGDLGRLLEKRFDGRILAFMRQAPAFLKTDAWYDVESGRGLDAQVAFGCRMLIAPAPSVVDSGVRRAWVSAYRYGYADPVLGMPLSNAVVTQQVQKPPNAYGEMDVLAAVVDGSGHGTFAWKRGLPAMMPQHSAFAIAGVAGPPEPGCNAGFRPSRVDESLQVLRFVRESPTLLDGSISVRNGGTLAFSDSFDTRWELRIDGILVDEKRHFVADGFGNGWIVQPLQGTHEFSIRYGPQRLFGILMAVEGLSTISMLILAIVLFSRAGARRSA
jgi:hypothetical protein